MDMFSPARQRKRPALAVEERRGQPFPGTVPERAALLPQASAACGVVVD
jgi:hypothetical protein